MSLSALPKYSLLTIYIRAALYGATNPLVQHMVERNRAMDDQQAMLA